jgi:hypothetical protein
VAEPIRIHFAKIGMTSADAIALLRSTVQVARRYGYLVFAVQFAQHSPAAGICTAAAGSQSKATVFVSRTRICFRRSGTDFTTARACACCGCVHHADDQWQRYRHQLDGADPGDLGATIAA